MSAPAQTRTGVDAARVRLEDFGDVLSDVDLAALLQVSPRWPEVRRREARRLRVAPSLPPTIQGVRWPRYRRVDVAAWLARESGQPTPKRRITA